MTEEQLHCMDAHWVAEQEVYELAEKIRSKTATAEECRRYQTHSLVCTAGELRTLSEELMWVHVVALSEMLKRMAAERNYYTTEKQLPEVVK